MHKVAGPALAVVMALVSLEALAGANEFPAGPIHTSVTPQP